MANEREISAALRSYANGTTSRRGFLKRAAIAGMSATAAGRLLTACTNADESASGIAPSAGPPVSGGTLIEGYDRAFNPMDPVRSPFADPGFNALYEGVIIRNPEGVMVPMLAESFEIGDDAWTFQIREGLRFHSGAELTPDNVVEDFELFRNPETGQNAPFWGPVTEVSADGQVVTVKVSHPFAAFGETLATEYAYIHNQDARDGAGDEYGTSTVDGSGPFQLVEFTPGQQVVVERWDDYPGSVVPFFENDGPAYLDQVRWVPILEAAQRAPEIETGNVHAVKNPPPQDVDRLKNDPDLVVIEFQELSNFFLSVNVGEARLGFDDVRVRQAISHAIDREAIVESIFFGRATATYGPVMPGWAYYDPSVEQFNQFDLERANTLLDEAGWTRSGDGTREKDGVPLSFETISLSETTEDQVMNAVSGMLAEVGIEMNSTPLEAAAYFETLSAETISYAFKWLWSSPIDVVALFVGAFQPESPELNAVNAAFEQWQTADDIDALEAAASQVQAVFAEQLPLIPIYTPNTVWVHRKEVHGWRPNQANLYPFYNDVWLEAGA